MPRPPAKPKVAYDWRVDGRETIATCRLCTAMFFGYSRNAVYPSTSNHRTRCPKVVEWREQMRILGIYVY